MARAPEDDARALADWLAGGEKGSRPPASLYECQLDRDAARLLVEAAMVEIDRALERRLEHIERNKKKMIEDARRDVTDARHRLQAHAQALPALRQALLDSRETLLWAAAYPDSDLEPVPVRPTSTISQAGCYRLRKGDPVDLRVSSRHGRVALSFLHEVGHFLDHQLGSKLGPSWASGHDESFAD